MRVATFNKKKKNLKKKTLVKTLYKLQINNFLFYFTNKSPTTKRVTHKKQKFLDKHHLEPAILYHLLFGITRLRLTRERIENGLFISI